MSISGPPSNAQDAALVATIARGVHVAVAAGNDGIDACNTSPGRVSQAYVYLAKKQSCISFGYE